MFKPLFGILMLLLLFSCSNPCDDVDCGANGACDEITGECICDDWYEGTTCEISLRDKFINTWASTVPCTFNNVSDPTWTITPGVAANALVIRSDKFFSGFIIEATMTDANNAAITPFSPGSSSMYTGEINFISESIMSMKLNVVLSSGSDFDCNFTMTK